MQLKVIDVSTWQPGIDWAKVKPQIDGAILRTGYGGDYPGQQDDTFEYNARECTRLGIPFGVYHYSYADSDEKARNEAAHILRLIKPYKLYYPVYLDLEEEKNSIRSFAPRACSIIGEIIEKAGYWFGVYANLNWWENYLVGVDKYTKWVAQYNNVCQYPKKHDIWQYSSTGKVSGIQGNVDMNICYRGFPAEIDVVKPSEPPINKGYKVMVTPSDGLNCRSGAGTGYDIVTAYPCGTELTITQEKAGWGRTDKGWVYLVYTKDAGESSSFPPARPVYSTGTYKVEADVLNVRKGPGTDYDRLPYSSLSANARSQIHNLAGYAANGYVKGMICDVSAVSGSWGRTPSGWINLDYTLKI